MADFPSDRRLALFGAWRQIRPGDRRETSPPCDGSQLRSRTVLPAVVIFDVRAFCEDVAPGRKHGTKVGTPRINLSLTTPAPICRLERESRNVSVSNPTRRWRENPQSRSEGIQRRRGPQRDRKMVRRHSLANRWYSAIGRLNSAQRPCARRPPPRGHHALWHRGPSDGRHQPTDELGSLRLAEIGVRHAPQPSADDEVAGVRRHRMLHDL